MTLEIPHSINILNHILYKYATRNYDRFELGVDMCLYAKYLYNGEVSNNNMKISAIVAFNINMVSDEHNTIKYTNKWSEIDNDFVFGDIDNHINVYLEDIVNIDDVVSKLLEKYPI